jgi:hypothetical protein
MADEPSVSVETIMELAKGILGAETIVELGKMLLAEFEAHGGPPTDAMREKHKLLMRGLAELTYKAMEPLLPALAAAGVQWYMVLDSPWSFTLGIGSVPREDLVGLLEDLLALGKREDEASLKADMEAPCH